MDNLNAATDRRSAVIDLVVVVGAAIVLIALLSLSPAAVVGGGIGIKLLFLSRMALLLLIATWRLRRSGRNWRDVGLVRPPLWRCVIAIVAGLLAIAVAVGVCRTAMVHAGYPAANYSAFAPLQGNLAEYLFWLVPVSIGSAAFGEEMIFRGFVLDAFERALGGHRWATRTAIVLQAAAFGLLHAYQGIGGVVTAGVTGLVLGFVWQRSVTSGPASSSTSCSTDRR